MTAGTDAPVRRGVVADWPLGWRLAGRLVLLAWVVGLGAAVLVGERAADVQDLYEALAAGEGQQVRIVGALPPGAAGTGIVELHWDAGHGARYAEVVQTSRPGDVGNVSGDDLPVVVGSVTEQLNDDSPGSTS